MPSVLVTGARGFVGSHVADELERRAVHTIRFSGDWRTLAPSWRIDALVHCIGAFNGDPMMTHTNVLSTYRALQYMPGARFVLASSGSAVNQTPYGVSKAAAEQLVRESDTPHCIMRLYYPVGAGQKRGLVPTLAERMRDGEAVMVGSTLSMTHIDDVAKALADAAMGEFADGLHEVAGWPVPVTQAVQILAEELDVLPTMVKLPGTDCIVPVQNASLNPADAIRDFARGVK